MAKLVPDTVQNKCKIYRCPWLMCQKCWHWYDPDPEKPKHHCQERDKPNRDLLKTCPGCRQGFYRIESKSWDERDRYERQAFKVTDRIVYSREHPKKNGVRVEMAVRNTRATNAARTIRPVRR